MNRVAKFSLTAAAMAGIATLSLAARPAQQSDEPVRAALLAAVDDEYLAEATYQAVLDKYGDVRPFSNIIQAERRHQQMVKAELDRRSWSYPANRYTGKIAAPASMLEACQTGVKAEVANIALYDRLLPTIDDPAAKDVLTRLQWASRENHLPAFQRCVDRGGFPGMGPGGGSGRRGGWQG
ncbi:DUF2202 domain-containing protein [Novosphingobium sp.]|uniref:ferritin-like domain-containing protein n=1 Tax=Novosphingobium sp. TaxID=1874826 RepID=UPI0025D158CD|nr:DUF2202 domain-containing protein [Novosphingobium sp.]